GKRGLELASQSLTKLNRLLKGKNILLTLVVYPWPHQIIVNNPNSIQVEYWQTWAKKNDVGFLNLFEIFFEGDAMSTIEKNFIPSDVHWNNEGHKLVAKKLLDFIKKRD
ncbi:MAG: SGNH/GDSL hydrolase family protein, partial [Proteobacteria bacterium]|nr:SGNH/GDSL hydrolase family protein [Pseudomonadota bacterium]